MSKIRAFFTGPIREVLVHLVGLCAVVSGALAYVAHALPAPYAAYVAGAGAVVLAVDRIALAIEKHVKAPVPPASALSVSFGASAPPPSALAPAKKAPAKRAAPRS